MKNKKSWNHRHLTVFNFKMHPKQAGMLTTIAVVSKLNIEMILVFATTTKSIQKIIECVVHLWCLEKVQMAMQ